MLGGLVLHISLSLSDPQNYSGITADASMFASSVPISLLSASSSTSRCHLALLIAAHLSFLVAKRLRMARVRLRLCWKAIGTLVLI